MAAAVTNPFTLTWGSFACGGTTERLIAGIHRVHSDFASFEVTCDVVIRGTSDSTFASNCAEMETEFSKRRQLVKFEVGTSTIQTFNPASGTNTGLNSYARIDKIGTAGADTDRSRLYTVTVGCEKPAGDTAGRRDSTVTVDYDPAKRRTVTISGVWTALTTNDATAQYAAQIDSWCSSCLTAVASGGTFERIAERTDRDDQDKTIRFSRTYHEIIVAQPAGSLDNTSVVEPVLAFQRAIDASGDSGGGKVKRLENVSARFECWLDKTASTDLAALYTGTILPFIKAQLVAGYAPSQWGIVSESATYDRYTNRLTCDVMFRCAINATDVIESVTTARIVEASGLVLTGAWTGQLFAKYADQGIATRRRFGIRAVRVLGTIKPKSRVGGEGGTVFGVNFSGGGEQYGEGNPNGDAGYHPEGFYGSLSAAASERAAGGGSGTGSGWLLIDNDSSATPRWLGKPGEDQIAVTDLVEQTVEEWVEAPGGGGGGFATFGPGSNN